MFDVLLKANIKRYISMVSSWEKAEF